MFLLEWLGLEADTLGGGNAATAASSPCRVPDCLRRGVEAGSKKLTVLTILGCGHQSSGQES